MATGDSALQGRMDSGRRQMVMSLADAVESHVEAIHQAGRDFLARRDNSAGEPKKLQIHIEVAAEEGVVREAPESGMDCWDADYICGKSASGYVHCTVRVCMEVGPVTVE
jgi:hypothetical protein